MPQAPLKILRIIARLNVGGPAIHAILLTEGLNDARMRSVLVAGRVSAGETDMHYLAESRGVKPIVLPRLGREISWLDDVVTCWQLFRIMRRERPDIVHTHTAKAGALGRLAGWLARVPVLVHTYHGHIFHGYFGATKSRVFVWIERLLGCLTGKIIAISDRQFAELCATYRIAPREKFAVIPLGFELSPFLQSRRRVGSQAGGCSVGIIGRLVPVKNHAMAVRALTIAVGFEPTAQALQLYVVGDGPLRGDLEREVQAAGLTKQVVFRGWQVDLARVYEELDLVLLTSANEGTPVVLIEAMAAGVPFIATNVGGVPDLMVGAGRLVAGRSGRGTYRVYDNGILVESGDDEGCAAAIQHLASNRAEGQRMAEVGRQFVQNRFAKERLLTDVRNLYHDLTQRTC